MALAKVVITDVDGNIPNNTATTSEKVTGLLFDISLQPTLFTAGYGLGNIAKLAPNDVIKVTGRKSASETFGIKERVTPTLDTAPGEAAANFWHGLPYYHIEEFYRILGNIDSTEILYVMFADCSSNWDAIETMQRVAGGTINQLGIYTEQGLWKLNGVESLYNLSLVSSINDKANALAILNQPMSIVLSANCSNTSAFATADATLIDIAKIPSCIVDASRTSVIFGQARNAMVSAMQMKNEIKCPVGFIGATMGAIAKLKVCESIGWVERMNIAGDNFQNIELGFGDLTVVDGAMTSLNAYESLAPSILDELDEKGYIFPIKYSGYTGTYISKDRTCSDGDYRTIARNRTINKSRRAVRKALLPYVNSPLLVNPSTGYLASSKITAFKTLVGDILAAMKTAQEISGYVVNISATQNVLTDGILRISYSIVPIGTAEEILVEEGLTLTA